jgi:hypothetical protein
MRAGAVNSFGLKPCVLLHDLLCRSSRLLAWLGDVQEFLQPRIDLLDRQPCSTWAQVIREEVDGPRESRLNLRLLPRQHA